jgi:two-component system, NarL family, response regulator LiaR
MGVDKVKELTQNGDHAVQRAARLTPAGGSARKVIVVDDDELFRRGLVVVLERHGIGVVAETAVAIDWVREAARLTPDVVLVDIGLNGMAAVRAIRRLTAAAPLTRALVLADATDDREVIAVLHAGACGYLLKTSSVGQIIDGVHAASRGECPLSPSIASRLIHVLRTSSSSTPPLFGSDLTAREREILKLLVHGADNRHIADALHLSLHTVNNYVSHILAKLQVENRIQAAVLAVRENLI